MRPELENIQRIEQYLANSLSPADRAAFEAQLAADPNLREELRLQQDLLNGLQRITRIETIRKARQHYYQTIWLKRGGLGLGALILGIAITFFALHHHNPQTPTNPSSTNAAQPTSGSTPGSDTATPFTLPVPGRPSYVDTSERRLPLQTFWLNPNHDTVIETHNGIVLSIPANGFLYPNRQPATGTIEFVIKEALDPASIIKAGLSTRAGNRLLETGGMFFVDARQNGRPLSIDPARAIYAEIPTDSIRPGMQLFTGNRLATGTIDWTNPRPLEHNLLPVDIQTLNFYPPHYLDSVAAWGHDNTNKTYTDSLYYSLARFFAAPSISSTVTSSAGPESNGDHQVRDTSHPKPIPPTPRDTFIAPMICGINPAKIKAIWNNTFNNTLISTREFEQRLICIHQSGDASLLDLYLNNLDKDLYVIDSLAARQTTGSIKHRFLAFLTRRDGHILHGDTRYDELRRYYRNKSKAYTEAIAKTQKDFWDKQQQLDAVASEKQTKHDQEYYKHLAANYREELAINMRSALSQLGYDTTTRSIAATAATETGVATVETAYPVQTYNAAITSTGWCNVDRYTIAQTSFRETIDYTDNETGKRAIIKYQSASFQVKDYHRYDRVTTYLLPDRLTSFMRLDADSTGIFAEKLNSQLTYSLVIIGYRHDSAFYYMLTNTQPAIHRNIPLTAIDKTTLDARLNSLASSTQAADLISEQNYLLFDIRDRPRRQRNQDLLDLTDKLLQAFFPCYVRQPVRESEPPPEKNTDSVRLQ